MFCLVLFFDILVYSRPTGIRVEWAKSRARANRFTEEVSLLSEEMKRVEQFFAFQANNWESRAEAVGKSPDMVFSSMRAEGWVAYAKRQAELYRSLIKHCKFLWKDVPTHITRMERIIADPSIALLGEFDTTMAAASST